MNHQPDKQDALRERETRQLRRLEVFVDVIFAVVLWRFFSFLPKPDEGGLDWAAMGIGLVCISPGCKNTQTSQTLNELEDLATFCCRATPSPQENPAAFS